MVDTTAALAKPALVALVADFVEAAVVSSLEDASVFGANSGRDGNIIRRQLKDWLGDQVEQLVACGSCAESHAEYDHFHARHHHKQAANVRLEDSDAWFDYCDADDRFSEAVVKSSVHALGQ